MARKPRWKDGEVMSEDDGLLVKGHVSLQEFNDIATDEYDQEPASAVSHHYVRFIPNPWEGYSGYFEHWGSNPTNKRGCIKATERAAGGEDKEAKLD